jgi:hypothetical protein
MVISVLVDAELEMISFLSCRCAQERTLELWAFWNKTSGLIVARHHRLSRVLIVLIQGLYCAKTTSSLLPLLAYPATTILPSARIPSALATDFPVPMVEAWMPFVPKLESSLPAEV